MNHIQITIATNPPIQEILIAQLAEIGFEGFEETEANLQAFIPQQNFVEADLQSILQPFQLHFTQQIIPQQNWNELWESNFEPITVDDFVGVRANFHPAFIKVQHEIIITPKMSFGTGHHATTYMVMQLMKDINFTNKTVFDFGSGTGILAILASKLGAKTIVAGDNDDWCIENSIENVANNNCTNILVEKITSADRNETFDIVIANINKNILLDNVEAIANCTQKTGILLLSGLLQEDEGDIVAAYIKQGFTHQKTIQKGNWIALQFNY
jgi:ribosomal protein L11 methyltransferase